MSHYVRNDRGELCFATIGRDVIYVGPGGHKYAAKIVHVWDKKSGTVNVVQFGDGVNDRNPSTIRMSVDMDKAGERQNTWHFADDFEAEATAFSSAFSAELDRQRKAITAAAGAPIGLQTFTIAGE